MKNYSITRQEAEVVSTNKYNEGFLIFGKFCQDIVFKTSRGNNVVKTLTEVNAPLYAGQKVTIILANDLIIAYEDLITDESFYLTNNLYKELGNFYVSWLSVIMLTLVVQFVYGILVYSMTLENVNIAGLPLLIPIAYRTYLSMSNRILFRRIGKLIEVENYN